MNILIFFFVLYSYLHNEYFSFFNLLGIILKFKYIYKSVNNRAYKANNAMQQFHTAVLSHQMPAIIRFDFRTIDLADSGTAAFWHFLN